VILFEELLIRLDAEGLTLTQAEQSQDPDVQHGLKGKKNRASVDKLLQLGDYLKPYPIDLVKTREEAEAIVSELRTRHRLGIDIETMQTADHPQAGLNPKVSSIRLVQLFDGERITVFDCAKIGTVKWAENLKPARLVAHNAYFEAAHFHQAGVDFEDRLDCTMLMGRVFMNRNIGLADMAKDAFGLELDKTLQVSDWGREALVPEQILYAAADAVVAYQLADRFDDWFIAHERYLETYSFLRSLIYPLVRQTENGVMLDADRHRQLVSEWQVAIDNLVADLAKDGLTEPTKTKAIQAYLTAKLSDDEQDDWPKTKTGNLSTNSEALNRLAHHPTLGKLGAFNQLRTRLANFGPKLQELLIDGRVYPGYMIAGMISGRFSSSSPNFQNLPRSGFKHVFIAPPGHQFVTGDLAQVELRVAGLISEDQTILDAYDNGQDLHTLMASRMTGKPVEEITKEERQAAKGVNFGLIYGGGAAGLQRYVRSSYGVEMTLGQAERAKRTFHATYKDLTLWQQAIVRHTNRHDESESIYSRLTRHFDSRDHYRDGRYSDIYTHAMNHPVQSTAWEILALAIRYVDEHAAPGVWISHHVYDELTLVAPDHLVIETAHLLKASTDTGPSSRSAVCGESSRLERPATGRTQVRKRTSSTCQTKAHFRPDEKRL